jgi:hypothetical protein
MLRRLSMAAAGGLLFAALTGGAALAAQPGAECGDPGAELSPPGFSQWGFSNAEVVYAGSEGAHSWASGNETAVSQYDIACVHYTTSHDR